MTKDSRLILPIALLLILIVLFTGCTSPAPSTPASPTSPPATPAPATSPAPSAQPAPSGSAVTIRDFSFNPGTLTVKAGTTVTWTNQDGPTHRIISDDFTTFASSPLPTGASFTFTFVNPGSYPYHCSIHPSMKGTVVVT